MAEDDHIHDDPPAADPASDHLTPGGNPASEPSDSSDSADVETTVETPGGTTVTESPAESSDE